MSDIQIVLIPNNDPNSDDLVWSQELQSKLQMEIDSKRLDIKPIVEVRPGFSKIPSINEVGPLSVLVLILPAKDRGFKEAEASRIEVFQHSCSRGDIRMVPLSRDPSRNVPLFPLNGIVSQKIYDLTQKADLSRLGNFLLNLVCLRLGGAQRKIFISYRIQDGIQIAAHLADTLRNRGYDVWRDESLDRDGQPLIGPGTEAQETIEKAILDHGFILVVDSPKASESTWVHAEIETAYKHMLPILPIVIEDAVSTAGQAGILIGGRFLILREMQRQVRVTIADQTGRSMHQFLDDIWFDKLEASLTEVLLGHLRNRNILIREAERRFRSMDFAWEALSPSQLLYEAYLNWHSNESPRLILRLLVQCSPFDVIQEDQVLNLINHIAELEKPYQYGILVCPTATNAIDKNRLLRQSHGHLLLLTPGEINTIPNLLSRFPTGGQI